MFQDPVFPLHHYVNHKLPHQQHNSKSPSLSYCSIIPNCVFFAKAKLDMPKLMVSEYSEDIFEYMGELKVGPSSLHVAYS